MGHLINPITYRLGKTKFWKNIWVNKSKKNYKKLLFEDFNFFKFFKWLVSILNWKNLGISLNDFNIIKSFNNINICFYFFFKKLYSNLNIKKLIYKFNLISLSKKIFIFKFLNKKFLKFNIFLKNRLNFKRKILFYSKNKNYFFKKKKIMRFFIKNINFKKKKKQKQRIWLSNFIFKYCFFLLKNKKNLISKSFFYFYSYFLNKNFKKMTPNIYFKKNISLKNFIIQKNSLLKNFNLKFFFRLLSFFLSFFLKNVFQHKNFTFNFFQKNNFFLNAQFLKSIIQNSVSNKNKISHIIKKIFRKTKKKIAIIGLKIGYFGRYEKKLRNKKVWQLRGSLSPSNINSVLSHKSFSILLRQGLCGIKISFLNKMNKNEIFKKKTFIDCTFKV